MFFTTFIWIFIQHTFCSFSRFADSDEFASIEIPLIHDFSDREVMFWVELYGQEKGVALGLKRTKVIVIKDEGKSFLYHMHFILAVLPVFDKGKSLTFTIELSLLWFNFAV